MANVETAVDGIKNQLHGLKESWLMCRDMRHAWVVDIDFYVQSYDSSLTVSELKRTLRCARCETRRHETYIPSIRWGLERIKTSYAYPDGYQMHDVPRGVKPNYLVSEEQYHRALMRAARKQKMEHPHE